MGRPEAGQESQEETFTQKCEKAPQKEMMAEPKEPKIPVEPVPVNEGRREIRKDGREQVEKLRRDPPPQQPRQDPPKKRT